MANRCYSDLKFNHMLRPKRSTCHTFHSVYMYTELIAMRVIQFLFVYILHNLKTTQGNWQPRCELTNRPTTDTRLANRALVGHSFKNLTVNKPYVCHLLCFVQKCRCQAYQMKGKNGCELLDEERFAAPNDLVEEKEYEYYDTSREYEKAVRYCQFEDNLSYKDGLSSFNWSIKGVENTDSYIAPFRLLLHIQWCGCENIVSGNVSLSHTSTISSFLRIEQRAITIKSIQKIRRKVVKVKRGKGGECMSYHSNTSCHALNETDSFHPPER